MGVQKKTRKFAQVKRIIGQRDARLKKNQEKGAMQSNKKKDEDVIREVYASWSCFWDHSDVLQSTSVLGFILPVQHCPCSPIPGPRRHEFPLPYSTEETRAPTNNDGLLVCEVCTYNYGMCHGRT